MKIEKRSYLKELYFARF